MSESCAPASVRSVNAPRSRGRAITIGLMPSSLRPLPARTRPAASAYQTFTPGRAGTTVFGKPSLTRAISALAPSSLDGHQLTSTCSLSSGSQCSTPPGSDGLTRIGQLASVPPLSPRADAHRHHAVLASVALAACARRLGVDHDHTVGRAAALEVAFVARVGLLESHHEHVVARPAERVHDRARRDLGQVMDLARRARPFEHDLHAFVRGQARDALVVGRERHERHRGRAQERLRIAGHLRGCRGTRRRRLALAGGECETGRRARAGAQRAEARRTASRDPRPAEL
jgi:hypothetical protein